MATPRSEVELMLWPLMAVMTAYCGIPACAAGEPETTLWTSAPALTFKQRREAVTPSRSVEGASADAPTGAFAGPRWRFQREDRPSAQALVAGLTPGLSLKNCLLISVYCF